MLKRLLASKPAVAVIGALAAAYIGLVYATSRIKRDPEDTDAKLFSQHPQILAMWHGQFLLLPKLKPKRPADVRAMISRHGDAALIGDVLERFGLSLIRGAGAGKRKRDRGGATALRESLRALSSGATVAMTADVPPGPARRAGEGIGTLASLSGRPVVPFAIATKRFITTPTWSAFTINLPFSTLAIVVGDPVLVPQTDDARNHRAGTDRHRKRSRRSHRARVCSGRSTRSLDQARHRQAWAVAQGLPCVDAPGGAARAHDPRLAHAARQGGARAQARALRHRQLATPAGLPRLVPCGKRRRGQRGAAGDRDDRRRASRAAHAAHHRHRHLGPARAHAAAARACCINTSRSTIRASCSASCSIGAPISPCWSSRRFGRTSCWRRRRAAFRWC